MEDVDAGTPPALEATKTISFDPPLKLGGEEYPSIELREPSAGELEDVDSLSGVAWTNALISSVAGVPKKLVRQIPATKLNACSVYLMGFVAAVR